MGGTQMGGIKKHYGTLIRLLIVFILAVMPVSWTAAAGVKWVPDEYETIQAAIDASAPGDEIVVRDGVYQGAGFCQIRFGGKAVTVRSENGRDACILLGPDDPGQHYAFIFDGGETDESILSGFTIKNFVNGPAVFISESSPVITGCLFTGNTGSTTGGALYAHTAHLTVIDSVFRNNHGGFDGGAIGTWQTTGMIADCVFDSNRNDDGSMEAYGGAIAAWTSAIDFINCLFIHNVAYGNPHLAYQALGGALFLDGHGQEGPFRLINCTIFNNRIEGDGFYPGICATGPIELRSCIIWDNHPSAYGPAPDIQYCILPQDFPGEGNMALDPLFYAPDQDVFYLSNLSPCIDSGHAGSSAVCFPALDGEVCLDSLFSVTGLQPDSGVVDRGYHYTDPWTETPEPTATPSPTPVHTPAPTATPLVTGVTITMPAHQFRPGDTCYCTVTVTNGEAEPLTDYPLFLILDVFGDYFYAPSFAREFEYYPGSWPPGTTPVEALPEFTWPDTGTSASGIVWYAAITDPAVTRIVGEWDFWEFGWL
jgi:predicted outer membrane repeat protein